MKCNKCGYPLPDDSLFCQYCGSKVEQAQPETHGAGELGLVPENPIYTNAAPRGFVLRDAAPVRRQTTEPAPKKADTKAAGADRVAIWAYVLAVLCAFLAMNLQDAKRNTMEPTSPTMLYLFLAGVCVIGVLCFVFSRKSRFPIAPYAYSIVPVVFTIVALADGSLFSDRCQDGLYINAGLIGVFNTVWLLLILTAVVSCSAALVTNIGARYRSGLSYRERCYDKIAKMKQYLDSGIITQQEYDRYREAALKEIEQ